MTLQVSSHSSILSDIRVSIELIMIEGSGSFENEEMVTFASHL